MGRVTKASLEHAAQGINLLLGTPVEPWGPKGSRPGSHYVYRDAAVWALERMENEKGATNRILQGETKSELLSLMLAFSDGILAGRVKRLIQFTESE